MRKPALHIAADETSQLALCGSHDTPLITAAEADPATACKDCMRVAAEVDNTLIKAWYKEPPSNKNQTPNPWPKETP